jgi:hypothetical protein
VHQAEAQQQQQGSPTAPAHRSRDDAAAPPQPAATADPTDPAATPALELEFERLLEREAQLRLSDALADIASEQHAVRERESPGVMCGGSAAPARTHAPTPPPCLLVA